MNQFSYLEATKFCTDYWYYNPQFIRCFETKYFELANTDSRLPYNPRETFRKDVRFFAFSSLFGEAFFTFSELTEYCSEAFSKLQRMQGLENIYYKLKESEPRLISKPAQKYQEWKGWDNLFSTHSKVFDSDFYSYTELQSVCIGKYQQESEEPKNLQKLFETFKGKDKKIPKNPYSFYKKQNTWRSWRDLFGLKSNEWATMASAVLFCKQMYESEFIKPTDLASYYLKLRDKYSHEIRLPRHPDSFYSKTNEWKSYKSLFGL